MAKRNLRSKNQIHPQQSALLISSPDSVLNITDPGDDIQRRFRYQNAHGVILFVAAIAGDAPYIAIWCENHEDLLAQRDDGTFDAYQIKTRQNELWTLGDDSLKHSIKRFIELNQQFPGKIHRYYFVSNMGPEKSNAQSKLGHNPVKFLKAVEQITSPKALEAPFNLSFEALHQYCQCEPLALISVLKKLNLVKGPGLDSYEAEIAHDHLASLQVCKDLPAATLATLRDDLIARIGKASSLSSNDPARHRYGLNEADHLNPYLHAKKITTESVLTLIRTASSPISFKNGRTLSESLQRTLDLYLAVMFKEDQVAKLDQAGETDSDRTTLLHQVFVDLELKPQNDQLRPPDRLQLKQKPLLPGFEQVQAETSTDRKKPISAMDCFLKETSARFVIIGGPGQGKSTLGQYLAQIHRAVLLKREKELYQDIKGTASQTHFRPQTERIPFRVVLKYFAQWLADNPRHETVEAYIAEQICKRASHPRGVNEKAIHQILKARPTLFIFDGLDEVTEQKLCDRMLLCIEDFLARGEQLGADMQVIATSRPTSYKGQFAPSDFWHLELQPMSPTKVNEFAANWINIKVPIEEEQRRIERTLQGCLKEPHTQELLTTPLQVTIILLIIKDRGRPPSQREALFQKYWSTILDREKAKAQDIILTDDYLLFSLHAYMGYILHKNAATKNTRSLLPAKEFEQLVYDFLRSEDNRSPEEAVRQRVSQMIKEAKTRLVLIVEPEKGFFGFEIRSLQEFFAGVYLVETAHNTDQRFTRLKTIAYLQHWHNVALFVSGRIINHYKGEAANILERVCRPIDRERPDIYLRRGAWLALDMAADGVFGSYRDLQASALEHALTVLAKGVTQQDQGHLRVALQKLPSEDRRDILSELLKEKLTSVPLSWQPTTIDVYGRFVGVDRYFMQALDALSSSNQQWLVIEALNLGYRHEVDPIWLATRLEKHWHIWIKKQEKFLIVSEWWRDNPQYTEKLLLALPLSLEQANELMDGLLMLRFFYYGVEKMRHQLMDSPSTLSEQIILLLQCLYIQNTHTKTNLGGALNFRTHNALQFPLIAVEASNKTKASLTKLLPLETLDRLIKREDLMPQLKACLWHLYLYICEPTKNSEIENFLREARVWEENPILSRFLKSMFKRSQPLLELTLEYQMRNDQNKVALLQPYVLQEPSIVQLVGKRLQKYLSRLSATEQLTTVLTSSYSADDFPEQVSIAEELGLSLDQLIGMYFTVVEIIGHPELSPAVLQKMFAHLEKHLAQFQDHQLPLGLWDICSWQLDYETAQQGMQVLSALTERFHHRTDILITIFFKLLTFDDTPLSLAPVILSCFANKPIHRRYHVWPLLDSGRPDVPLERLVALAKLVKHEDTKIQQGATAFWAGFIEQTLTEPYTLNEHEASNLAIPEFDWQLSLSLVRNTDAATKKQGIILLTHARLPIAEKKYFDELCNVLSEARDPEEIKVWVLFLNNVLIRKSERPSWQKLLETLIANPQHYASHILAAAMERYKRLIINTSLKIRNAAALDLS